MNEPANKAVFLSYASQDAEAARRICEALRAAGVEVWFDQSELVGGDAWDAKIRTQIKECALFVPVISANTQARREGYFRLEWRLADQRTHLMSHDTPFILPVVIDETRDHDARVPESFLAVQWTRLPHGQVGPSFCERVKALLDGGDSSTRESREGVERAAPSNSGGNGFGKRSPPGKWPGVLLLLSVAAVAVALIAFALRRTWKSPQPISPRSDASQRDKQSAESSPPMERASSPAVIALLTRARALATKTDVVRSDLDTAASLLEQAAKQEPTNARVWAERSLVDWRYLDEYLDRSMARLDSARRHAAQAIGIEPENPLARLAQAAAMTAVQRDSATKQRAIQLLEPIVDRITDRADGLYLLASLQTPDAALGVIDRAARMPGEAGRSHLKRAGTFIRAGRMREADEAASHALAVERSTSALLAKSYYLTIWHGDTAEAQRLHAEVPSEVWGEDFAASARYFVELWAGKPDRALAAMKAVPREFIESYALSGPTGYYRGYALARANRLAAAETEWRSALAVVQRELASRPNDQTLLTFSALLHWHVGDQTGALKVWQSLRELTGGRLISWENSFLQMTILPEEEAISKLESLPPSGMFGLAANLRLNPYLDRFRNHPRFVALQARSDADPRSSPRAARSAPTSAKSVAVLAFDNLSDDKANEYFSDGIADELLTVLQKIPGLRVAARTSAFSFKGKNATAKEVGEKLGMAHVVEGSVQKSGKRVKITARLSRAASNEEVWSESFGPLELTDVFATQSEIAQKIIAGLRGQLTGGATTVSAATQAEIKVQIQAATKGGTENAEAYRLYRQGRYHFAKSTQAGWAEAERCFNEALQLDPRFAQAYSGLADLYGFTGGYLILGRTAWAKQRELAEKALALVPDLADARFSLGLALSSVFEWKQAEEEMKRAIELNPNLALARDQYAWLLTMNGRMEEALRQSQQALELDPLSPVLSNNRAVYLLHMRRDDEAVAQARRTMALQPNDAFARSLIGWALTFKGDHEAAARQFREARALDDLPWFAGSLGYALARAGDRAGAEAILRELDTIAIQRWVATGVRVYVFLGLGDHGRALDALEKAFEEQDQLCWNMKVDRVFDPIRHESRFRALQRKAGLD